MVAIEFAGTARDIAAAAAVMASARWVDLLISRLSGRAMECDE
jgi:hypothetical protein